MADMHMHGEYGHNHDGGEAPHEHSGYALSDPKVDPTEEAITTTEGDAIEAVQEIATHAIDAMVETHRQEEETEQCESDNETQVEIVEAITEAAVEAQEVENDDEDEEDDSDQQEDSETQEDEEEDLSESHDMEDEPTMVIPPQTDDMEGRRVAKHPVSVSRFRARRLRRAS